jgi:sRNA-binding carbon storage regulator CsrA
MEGPISGNVSKVAEGVKQNQYNTTIIFDNFLHGVFRHNTYITSKSCSIWEYPMAKLWQNRPFGIPLSDNLLLKARVVRVVNVKGGGVSIGIAKATPNNFILREELHKRQVLKERNAWAVKVVQGIT